MSLIAKYLAKRRVAPSIVLLLLIGVVAPVLALGVPPRLYIPIVKAHRESDPPAASVFSHWTHEQYDCSVCHPSVFPKAHLGFTHDDIDAGKYCGTCHDSKTAFSIDDPNVKCAVCHRR